MATDDLTAQRLRELFHYDQETGVFTRRVVTCNKVKVGDIAGSSHHHGYLRINVCAKQREAHRLAWLYMTGAWPQGQIDHINGLRDDNRFANLRDVPRSVNMQNQRRAQSTNKAGLLGVGWHDAERKWTAQIQIDGTKRHLGMFDTPEAAHSAYLIEKRRIHAGCTI